MTSAHQHHSRYSLPPPPQNSQNDFRLPSLKDLNFQYRSPNGAVPPQPNNLNEPAGAQQEHPPNPRHVPAWARSNPPSNPANSSLQSHPHQQHTPPLSAGHDATSKAEYPSKHENGGYVHPGSMPLSAQVTPAPGSVNIGTLRNEDTPHSPQPKRPRTTSTNVGPSRDVRPSHNPYAPPQYASYPPTTQPPATSPYHQIPSGVPGPSTHSAQPVPPPPPPSHDPMHHHPIPVPAHPAYPPPYYMQQPRPPVMHQQQHPTHPPQPTHSNPYPSPGPPPSAPPPQGPWGHQQPQHPPPSQHPTHQHPPPPPQPPQQHLQQHPSHIQLQHQQQPIPANPSYVVPQHHLQPPPPAPPQPQPQQHVPQQQHSHQFQQPQPQQQQLPFARTTPIVPTNVDTHRVYATSEQRIPPGRSDAMTEIANQCTILYSFANRYAEMQNHMHPAPQPSQTELEEMSQRAQHVVRLLEDLRRLNAPETEQSRVEEVPETMQESPDDPRPPKRPWEDISQDVDPSNEQHSFSEQYPPVDNKPQSTAEQDMELIRTKRATTTASASGPPGQPKSKYRKRSRATPPGKCHSCNIRETPEWRRGPDGARTLCNACGLHYAKLMRKRDKNGPNGEAQHIDLETLRASARAADIADKASRSSKQSRSHQSEPASPADVKQHTPQQHHQGTFQLVNMMAPGSDPGSSTISSETSRPPPPIQSHSNMPPPAAIPPPPWATSAPPSRPIYAAPDHLQHQSFIRGSQHNAPSR